MFHFLCSTLYNNPCTFLLKCFVLFAILLFFGVTWESEPLEIWAQVH